MGLGTLDKTVDNSLFANDCTPFMCYTASQLFLAPGLYLPTFLIATLMTLFFLFSMFVYKENYFFIGSQTFSRIFSLKIVTFPADITEAN